MYNKEVFGHDYICDSTIYIFRVDISTFVVDIFTDDNEFISILL